MTNYSISIEIFFNRKENIEIVGKFFVATVILSMLTVVCQNKFPLAINKTGNITVNINNNNNNDSNTNNNNNVTLR